MTDDPRLKKRAAMARRQFGMDQKPGPPADADQDVADEPLVEPQPAPPPLEPFIDQPGVYPDVTAEQYHADPVIGGSLTSSGARALLPPSCPARYHHDRTHGSAPRRHFDLGHAAHRLVLGVGPELEIVEADNWRTKAAREQADTARAAGRTPLLAAEHATVTAMADALRQHNDARLLLAPDHGWPEVTLVWDDPATGVRCRARLDWLPHRLPGHRLLIPDYKTCAAADLESLRKAMTNWGYHQQAAWYLDGIHALGLAPDGAAFLFIAQEKTAPYLTTVFEPDGPALRAAAARNHTARTIYQHCTSTGHWPAYHDGVALLSLPRWAELEAGDL